MSPERQPREQSSAERLAQQYAEQARGELFTTYQNLGYYNDPNAFRRTTMVPSAFGRGEGREPAPQPYSTSLGAAAEHYLQQTGSAAQQSRTVQGYGGQGYGGQADGTGQAPAHNPMTAPVSMVTARQTGPASQEPPPTPAVNTWAQTLTPADFSNRRQAPAGSRPAYQGPSTASNKRSGPGPK